MKEENFGLRPCTWYSHIIKWSWVKISNEYLEHRAVDLRCLLCSQELNHQQSSMVRSCPTKSIKHSGTCIWTFQEPLLSCMIDVCHFQCHVHLTPGKVGNLWTHCAAANPKNNQFQRMTISCRCYIWFCVILYLRLLQSALVKYLKDATRSEINT